MIFEEDRFQYKWQEDFADEIDTLTFNELIDELINIAQLGDRMEKRDDWKLDYMRNYLKLKHGGPEPVEIAYRCPKCERPGFPSIYYNSCTNCANIKRGV